MRKSLKVLIAYIVIIFALQSFSLFFAPLTAGIYLAFALLATGITAIIFQKAVHHEKFLDMGFRLNRNALIGTFIGLLFTAIVLGLAVGLPVILGFCRLELNTDSPVGEPATNDISGTTFVLLMFAFGVPAGFIMCLFGEELAFRGYILLRLEQNCGALWAVIICSLIFGLWHLPVYFNVYAGGAAREGPAAVAVMLFFHAVTVVPVCILYLTTRELYGVSLYHTLVDVFQYSLVMNPALGEASKLALYRLETLNETAMRIAGLATIALQIPIMLGFCAIAKRITLKPQALSP